MTYSCPGATPPIYAVLSYVNGPPKYPPTVLTLPGIVICVIDVASKTPTPILVTVSGIVTDARFLLQEKAKFSIKVTPSGITTESRKLFPPTRSDPIPVTA